MSQCAGRVPLSVIALVVAATVTGCGTTDAGPTEDLQAGVQVNSSRPVPGDTLQTAIASTAAATPPPGTTEQLPGLGPLTLARIPGKTKQVVLVTGDAKNSSRAHLVIYQRTLSGWQAGTKWPAHNALKGWTDNHHAGDLHSPIGVFSLTDAGGRLANPGTKLPYDRSPSFVISGTGFDGEPLAGSFDYVVAINYNRVKGTTPLNSTRPEGEAKGGDIWLHVDHSGPTHGCVTVAKNHMKELLRTLNPALHPVIVMGDATSLLK